MRGLTEQCCRRHGVVLVLLGNEAQVIDIVFHRFRNGNIAAADQHQLKVVLLPLFPFGKVPQQSVDVFAHVLSAGVQEKRLIDMVLFPERFRIGLNPGIHTDAHADLLGGGEVVHPICQFHFRHGIVDHAPCFHIRLPEQPHVHIGFVMEAGDQHRLFRTTLHAVVCRAEHIRNKDKQTILVGSVPHILVQLRTVDHFLHEDLFFLGRDLLAVHQLPVHAVKSGSVPPPHRKPANRDVSHHGSSCGVIVFIPVGGEFLDTCSQDLHFHTCLLQVCSDFPQFHFCTAGNIFSKPRNNESNFLHDDMTSCQCTAFCGVPSQRQHCTKPA